MSFEIRLDKRYKHPIEKVWRAISEAELISAWFIKAEFKAEQGYNYVFTHESTEIKGEVLEVEPPSKLVYTWVVGDPNVITKVEWLLSESNNETVLEIVHTGIEDYGKSAASFFENFSNGWASCLDNLGEHLNQ